MSQSGERQEKATPRRVERARREGRFISSRVLVGAGQFAAVVYLVRYHTPGWIAVAQEKFRRGLLESFTPGELTLDRFTIHWRTHLVEDLVPLWMWGLVLVLAALVIQSLTTQFGWATANLAPRWDRLNPAPRLAQLPRENLGNLGQVLLLLPLVGLLLAHLIAENLAPFAATARAGHLAAVRMLGFTIEELLRNAAIVFLFLGAIDYVREYRRYHDSLKMSKQEIKEEHKESEGSPEIKQRVRRLQRQYSRRRMMADVEKATAVITNPTHYAVAIRFDFAQMAAPRVVGKGKNYLAQRIRERAQAKEIPLVENPPLAQALYRSVRVGEEIPPHLYRAVAEVLAYLYRLMGHRFPGAGK